MEQNILRLIKDLNILVVEDDVVSRMLLSEILKDFQSNIFYARNGQEAVDLVKNNSYDLILMDLKMPIMNGYDATQIIRDFGYTKPIIAQTAYASIFDKSKVMSSGFDAYLTKPISRNGLLDVLSKLLEH